MSTAPERILLRLIAAAISRHQCTCIMTYFKGFIWNPPVFCSVAMLWPVRKKWRPLKFWPFRVVCFGIRPVLGISVDSVERNDDLGPFLYRIPTKFSPFHCFAVQPRKKKKITISQVWELMSSLPGQIKRAREREVSQDKSSLPSSSVPVTHGLCLLISES